MSLLALALVVTIGYAAHRASLCNVRAVAEVLEGGRPRLLASFFQAAAWMALVSAGLLMAMQGALHPAAVRTPLAVAMVGAAVFGVGAALNGGCSLSTLQRLADGELAMLGTLLGFALGLVAWTRALAPIWADTRDLPFALATDMPWKGAVLLALVAWALWELLRLARGGPGVLARLRASPWQPASAAAVLGIGGGLLYTLQGSWNWTGLLAGEVEAVAGQGMPPGAWALAVLLSMVAGMGLSSWQRRAFALRRAPAAVVLRSVAAGGLMGLGAGALPGGNDAVVLVALPTLAPQAFAVYGAMLGGITITLWATRARASRLPRA